MTTFNIDENGDIRFEGELLAQYAIKEFKSKYPHDFMAVGDKFFIEQSEDVPKPWVKMANVNAWANRRFAPKMFRTKKCRLDNGKIAGMCVRVL